MQRFFGVRRGNVIIYPALNLNNVVVTRHELCCITAQLQLREFRYLLLTR
jgi:hypothetical protein